MQTLLNIDLANDLAAATYVKDEIVDVTFAKEWGEIMSSVGLNRYEVSDALIIGSNGDRWSVSRDRFDARYLAVAPTVVGDDGRYRAKPSNVFAKQMAAPFSIARSAGGDMLRGKANDWLLQYAPGDFGIVDNDRFQRVYRRE
jgi:PGDYG protein